MKYAIVSTDNFGSDYPNESFVSEPYGDREVAQAAADAMNVDDHQPRYYKVVELPYRLEPGFEP